MIWKSYPHLPSDGSSLVIAPRSFYRSLVTENNKEKLLAFWLNLQGGEGLGDTDPIFHQVLGQELTFYSLKNG